MEYLLLQMLNGVQLGLLMFLLAAGLTLTFGIMDLVNLAHMIDGQWRQYRKHFFLKIRP